MLKKPSRVSQKPPFVATVSKAFYPTRFSGTGKQDRIFRFFVSFVGKDRNGARRACGEPL